MIEVTDVETFTRYLQFTDIVIVDFYASWCGPCKLLTPKLEELSHQVKESAVFLKVNIDNFGELVETYEITGLPTVKVFHRSHCVYTSTGFTQRTIQTLQNEINKY
jgi:thioredoxin 1